jgi:hypothetical protein
MGEGMGLLSYLEQRMPHYREKEIPGATESREGGFGDVAATRRLD